VGSIAIKLDPSTMANPDLDIRYKLPELLTQVTSGRVQDDGYDYLDDGTLVVFLSADDPEAEISGIVEALRTQEVCGNAVLECSVIGVSAGVDLFRVVHPPGSGESFRLDSA